MTTKFYCDKCGKEFFEDEECAIHERTCGIEVKDLNFTLYDIRRNKISSNNLVDEAVEDYKYIYIKDRYTFDSLNKLWKETGYESIPDDEFEKESIYIYDDDAWEGWSNYTKELKEKTKQVEEMMVER